MMEAFSSSSEAVLQRVVTVGEERDSPLENIEEYYQIKKTCDFINHNHFQKVALQFPDELLVDSVAIATHIERNTAAKLFILGDTSYGSCCVDEVAAEHVGADCIVHYGRSCLSPTRRLPLMYVFERRPVDLEKCAAAFADLHPDARSHVVVLYDVNYAHAIGDLQALLAPKYPNMVTSTLLLEGSHCHGNGETLLEGEDGGPEDGGQEGGGPEDGGPEDGGPEDGGLVVRQFGRHFVLKRGLALGDYAMFFVGSEGATLRNFMMTWSRCAFASFDPSAGAGRAESPGANRALARRYYAVERARDAGTAGILVGTLGVADYLAVIRQLKATLRAAGKRSYVFAMGKLNVAKLANFLEVDVYVLVACPENSLLDAREFYRPVVTPFEMEVACNRDRAWTGEYVTDFRHLLPGGRSHVPPADDNGEDCEETDVSLITGALRRRGPSSDQPAAAASSLVPRNQMLTVADSNSAASRLAGRSWQGLERRLGETAVTKAVQGRRGIAIAYEDEGTSSG